VPRLLKARDTAAACGSSLRTGGRQTDTRCCTQGVCCFCKIVSTPAIYSSRRYTHCLFLLPTHSPPRPPPTSSLLMFGVAARNRALFTTTTASSRTALTRPVAGYRGSFLKGVRLSFFFISSPAHFTPIKIRALFCPNADITKPTVCSHHGCPTKEKAEQSARW